MKPRRPRLLTPGDTVALLALSSPSKSRQEVDAAVAALEGFGLRVRRGRSLNAQRDYLAGSDLLRAHDFSEAVADRRIAGIFFLRGGYGSARILPLVDWAAAARARKPVVGFSDLTSVLAALDRAGLATLHAPTLASHFVAHPSPPAVREHFARCLFSAEPLGDWTAATAPWRPITLHPGRASGALVGGNLTVFTTLLGTRWLPRPEGRILFLEDVGEKTYRLDRMITHLRNAGYLERLAGILLGQFTDCDPATNDRWDALRAITEGLAGLRIPILAGLPSGHDHPSWALPLGLPAEMDASDGSICFPSAWGTRGGTGGVR